MKVGIKSLARNVNLIRSRSSIALVPAICPNASGVSRACYLGRPRFASTARPTRMQTCSAALLGGAAAVGAATPSGAVSHPDVRDARVAVMSIPACPYCRRAKEALTEASFEYVDVNVGDDDALRQVVRDLTGKRTVPQIFVGGRSVGGCDDLLSQLADGSFQRLLAEVGSAAAVPPELLAAIEAAGQRAAEAQAAAASEPDSGPLPRLRDLAARLALSQSQGGIGRTESRIGSRVFLAFTSRQLLDWLTAAGETDPRVTARQLLDANLLTPAAAGRVEAERAAVAAARPGSEDLLLMLPAEAPRPVAGETLNTQFWWQGPTRPANEVASSLRHLILDLYDKHLSKDGRSVSYGAIRSDPLFAEFVAATAELQKVDLAPLNREELIAFAINLYNALIIHALVSLGLTRMTSTQRATFYSRTAKYNIGGLDYSADDLENGVLRGNRAGAANLFNLVGLHSLAGGQFGRGDPRAAKVVTPVDARIHFALVCGAKSCPPIKLYTAANLEEGLAAAAEAFCATEVEVDLARREVRLSKILKWYAVDFGANKNERLSTVAAFLSEPAKGDLMAMLKGGGDIKVSYKEYDWSLNGTD